MSEPSKSDQVKAKLRKNLNPNPVQIKEWAKEIGCSEALVYKWKRRLADQQPELLKATEAGEPVVTVGDEKEEIIEEAEEVGEQAFEPPEVEEEAEIEERAEGEEVAIGEQLEAEEENRLKEIAGRAIARIFDVAIAEVLDLEEAGLNKQESEDTNFLAMLMIAKYLKVEVTQYMLEFTSGLHFGSIGLKILVKWLKKRRAEKKAEEDKPVPTPQPQPQKEPEPEQPTAQEEAHEETEEERKKRQSRTDKEFLKRVSGGR